MKRVSLLAVVVSLAAVVGVSCAPQSYGSTMPGAPDGGQAAEHLKGSWVLLGFEPEVSFDPILFSLMAAQVGALTVTFDGETMDAQGPGIAIVRSYEVVQSLFTRIDIVIFGDDGTTYQMLGQFTDGELQFQSRTEPWRGTGRLRRL